MRREESVQPFVYTGLPARVVFGPGALDQLLPEVERLGLVRVLVLSTPGQRALAEDVARRLGARAAGIFDRAVMHVPVDIAAAARDQAAAVGADGCVAVGGGTAIGVGKSIALTTHLPAFPIVAVPTTFSGSEMTPVWGLTDHERKQTGRDPRVLPRAVIYDPRLLMALPAAVAGPSGMNAIAHCVEALYARDANPMTSLMAEEGIRALGASLPRVVGAPDDEDARAQALYGAWLAGACLGAVGMSLHHKLCHTLGGRYNLPHAETHAAVLPHAVAYNRAAAPAAMARIARALGGGDPAQVLFDLGRALGISMSLGSLAGRAPATSRSPSRSGSSQPSPSPPPPFPSPSPSPSASPSPSPRFVALTAEGLDEAARLATKDSYPNPRAIEFPPVRQLLQDAWEGRRPEL